MSGCCRQRKVNSEPRLVIHLRTRGCGSDASKIYDDVSSTMEDQLVDQRSAYRVNRTDSFVKLPISSSALQLFSSSPAALL